jgi:hypothetical protein
MQKAAIHGDEAFYIINFDSFLGYFPSIWYLCRVDAKENSHIARL